MKAIPPHHIRDGGHYWASWGDKGWTAVYIISAKRKWAKVDRVDPRTGTIKKRNAKVRVDEMVKRNPKLNGSDKPEIGPAVVFAKARKLRTELAEFSEIKLEPTPVEEEVEEVIEERTPKKFHSPEEGEAFLEETWVKTFGREGWEGHANNDELPGAYVHVRESDESETNQE